MATSYVTAAYASNTNVTVPSQAEVGDVLLLVSAMASNGGSSTNVTGPSGWTALTSPNNGAWSGYKIATSADLGSSVGGQYTNPGAAYLNGIAVYRPATSNPVNVAAAYVGSVTTTAANTVVVQVTSFRENNNTLDSTATVRYSFNGFVVGDLVQAAAGATPNSSSNTYGIVIALYSYSAPNAPMPTSPANAAYLDGTAGITFAGTYNSSDGYNANARALREKVSGASAYSYWNNGTGAFQSTIVWNTVNIAPGGSGSFGPITFTDGQTINWSMADQEAGANLQGPFASDFTLSLQAGPALTIVEPQGTVTVASDTSLTYTATPGSGSSIIAGRWLVYPLATTQASGFAINIGAGTIPAGATSDVSWTGNPINVALQSGVVLAQASYVAYAAVEETGSIWSSTITSGFTLSYDVPATPTVTAAPAVDATGVPYVSVTVQGHDNILSATDASFETGTGTAAAGSGTAIYASTVWALDGSHSLAMESVAGAAVSATEGPYAVVAGETFTFTAAYHAVSATRACHTDIAWYNGTTLLSTTTGTTVTDSATGGTAAFPTAVAPAGATEAYLIHNVATAVGQLATPAAPSVAQIAGATAGTTTYDYSMAVSNVYGSTPTSSTTAITNGNATLSASEGNLVSWPATPLPAGSSGNLVYDSNLTNAIAAVGPTWVHSGGTIGSANGDVNVLNAGTAGAEWVFYGTGASADPSLTSQVLDVTPGATYTLSALINAANATAGSGPCIYLANAGNTAYESPVVTQAVGANGVVSSSVTIASGITQVIFILSVNNTTVTAGSTVSWSQIQLTETSTAQPYEPGPLPTYTVYGRSGSALTELGSTTALALQDTGQALGTAVPATTNTTGETHLVDEAGIFPGTVTAWSAGGFAGSTTTTITRSDGLIVRGANNVAVPTPSQTFTVNDYEAIPGQPYTYSATITAPGPLTSTAGISPSATLIATSWWLVDPLDPSQSISLNVLSFPTTRHEQLTVHYPLGSTYPTIIADTVNGQDGQVVVQTQSQAEFLAVDAAAKSQRVKWLINPIGEGFYVRLGASSPTQGISGQVTQNQLVPSTAAAPNRTTTYQYVEVARP